MFLDNLLVLCDAQAFTVDAVSSNVLDLGNVTPKREIGTGEPMGIGISVDVAADHTTGDETYAIEVIDSAAADLSSPTVLTRRVLTFAQLVAGARHFLPLPPGTPTQRYLGINVDGGGTTPTVTLTAWLTPQSMFSILAKPYAKSYAV